MSDLWGNLIVGACALTAIGCGSVLFAVHLGNQIGLWDDEPPRPPKPAKPYVPSHGFDVLDRWLAPRPSRSDTP